MTRLENHKLNTASITGNLVFKKTLLQEFPKASSHGTT